MRKYLQKEKLINPLFGKKKSNQVQFWQQSWTKPPKMDWNSVKLHFSLARSQCYHDATYGPSCTPIRYQKVSNVAWNYSWFRTRSQNSIVKSVKYQKTSNTETTSRKKFRSPKKCLLRTAVFFVGLGNIRVVELSSTINCRKKLTGAFWQYRKKILVKDLKLSWYTYEECSWWWPKVLVVALANFWPPPRSSPLYWFIVVKAQPNSCYLKT